MNNCIERYPSWWDKTITLYNKYVDPITRVVTWHSYIIDGCFWDNTGNRLVAENAQIQSNDVVCRIRKNKLYISRKEWEALPNDQMTYFFTLGKDDILICGAVDDVINEDIKGHRATDLVAKYKNTQDCIVVKRFSDNTGSGRCMPHYYVIGE